MSRTTFLVDGFNLYHSVVAASTDLAGESTKWLDIHSLLSSYLHVVGKARLEKIYYFSALADYLDYIKPGTTKRHKQFIECLVPTGVIPILGRFKEKEVYCPECGKFTPRAEEKETDVAISMKLIEVLSNNEADAVVLVSGDTDLVPAVCTASKMFPKKKIYSAFPYKRKNKELAKLVEGHFHIKKERYPKHQFPDPVVLPGGKQIAKPSTW